MGFSYVDIMIAIVYFAVGIIYIRKHQKEKKKTGIEIDNTNLLFFELYLVIGALYCFRAFTA